MGTKKLYKSRTDKKLSGVCAGFGDYLGIDVTLIRIAWFAISWFYGIGLFAYILCAILLPQEPY